MKNQFLIIAFLLVSCIGFSQEKLSFKEYSFSEFLQMIEEEKDSIFVLKDALIKPNSATDSLFEYKAKSILQFNPDVDLKRTDTIVIDKAIELDNVNFISNKSYGLSLIRFNKPVEIKNMVKGDIINCTFAGHVKISHNKDLKLNSFEKLRTIGQYHPFLTIVNNTFLDGLHMNSQSKFKELTDTYDLQIIFNNNTVYTLKNRKVFKYAYASELKLNGLNQLNFENNTFKDPELISLDLHNIKRSWLRHNVFENSHILFNFSVDEDHINTQIIDNSFLGLVVCSLDYNFENVDIADHQFKNELVTFPGYFQNYLLSKVKDLKNPNDMIKITDTDSVIDPYLNHYRAANTDAFRNNSKIYGKLYNYYKENHDKESANSVYIKLKNLETQRLEYLYETNPTFKTYFTWKTNQFLKVFSAYGTEPARAIIYSVYVILIFGFIYLFFPNSWDKHGKNRIVDRYNFFFTYMKRKAGIHEVYLDDQKEELMSYEQFKENINNSNQKVPRFFTATALPLYKWAISGTQFSASILKRIDIMKGTWSELPPSKRIWKSILLISAFLVAILYDITIKILNALMLSINTFTTLGFGEIPIKGLPRYLAIIQGFIGWFMLTIFSVSLISQLLN